MNNDPSRLRRLLSLPGSPGRLDAEADAEIRFHLEERIAEFMATGLSRTEAEAEVQRRFGDPATWRARVRAEDARGRRGLAAREWLATLRRETARALRALLRAPGFSVVAVVTLALGIGAATAMFSVLDAVVLRPLPYPEPERLVAVLHPATVPGSGERKWGVSPGGYFHFANRATTLSAIGLYRVFGMTVTGGPSAEVVDVAQVTASVFDVLRMQPVVGRLITPDDDRPDSTRRVVLGHAFWQRHFGGDPAVVGQAVETSEGRFEVIGVAPPGLTLPLPGPFSDAASLNGVSLDLWLPLKLNPAGPHWNNHPFVGLARLAPGRSVAQAQSELATLTAQLPAAVPNAYNDAFLRQYNFRVEAAPLRQAVLGPTLPRTLWMLFASVVLVLAIAAANVGNLFLVRLEARRREVAVRAALGANRRHLALHFLGESCALAGAGGTLGLALAWATLKGVLALAPRDTARLSTVALSGTAVAFAVALSITVALVFGLAPLLGTPGGGTLREEGRSATVSRVRRRARDILVVAQLAIALVLLAGAGLLLRSASALANVQAGFATAQRLVFDVSLPWTEFDTREKALVFHRELQARLAALPGVKQVSGGSTVPLDGGFGTGCSVVFRVGRPFARGEQTPCVSTPMVLPGYFRALGIQVKGRLPDWGDVAGATQATVVTAALARRLWGDEDPIGQRIGSNGSDATASYEVVGVIPEIRAEALDRPPTEAVFYPATGLQKDEPSGAANDVTWVVELSGQEPLALVPVVRRLLAELNPAVPMVEPRTMEMVRAHSMARLSFAMVMLTMAAGVAVLLSVVGTYGVVSYLVSQRRGEIGVRLALGAQAASVSRMVLGDSMRLGVLGVGLGLLGAWLATRLLRVLLFEVSPTDPWTMAGAATLLVCLAAVAALVPARRAARTDPADVLRR